MSGLDLDLSSAHDLVLDAARRGAPAVFGPVGDMPAAGNGGGDGHGHGHGRQSPAGAPSVADRPPGGARLLPYDDDDAWVGRTIDGAWLAKLLTGGEPGALHGRGLTIHGARILGGLDLEGAELPCRLDLAGCQLGPHRIVLRDARTRTVDLTGIRCAGIDGDQVHVAGAVVLRRAVVAGGVRLIDARIEASLLLDGARIEAPGAMALDASHVQVMGSVLLRSGFRAAGEVRFSGATIGDKLDAVGARLHNPDDGAWRAAATGAADPTADTGVPTDPTADTEFADPGPDPTAAADPTTETDLPATGPVDGGPVDVDPADLAHRARPHVRYALRANGMRVEGSMFLNLGFTAQGHVQMFGLRVGGDLLCADSRFENPGGDALSLDGAEIAGSLFLRRAVTVGRVRLVNGRIGGDVVMPGARMSHPGNTVLSAGGAEVSGSVYVDQGFLARGEVKMPGVQVGRDVRAMGARFENPGRVALRFDGARVGGGLRFEDSVIAGQLRVVNGNLGGDLTCSRARVEHPEGQAIYASRVTVAGNVFLDQRFRAVGEVRLPGATIGGALRCTSASLHMPESGPSTSAGMASGASTGAGPESGASTSAGTQSGVSTSLGPESSQPEPVADDGQALTPPAYEGYVAVAPPDGVALNVDAAQIGAEVLLDRGFTATGGVRLTGTTIGGGLDCRDARLDGGGQGSALNMRGARVAAYVLFSRGFTARGPVRFMGATIGGDVNCQGAQIVDPGHISLYGGEGPAQISLHGSGAHIGGTLFLTDGFRAEGEVRLLGVSIARDLFSVGATITATSEVAMGLTRARINGDVVLARGFHANGTVRLARAVVGGHLDCGGGTFSNPGGRAIDAPNLQVGGAVLLGKAHTGQPTTVEGEVHLVGGSVGGNVQLGGAQVTGPEGGRAVDATGVQVTGGVDGQGAAITGGFLLRGTTIGGTVHLAAAHITGAAGDYAVDATNAHVTGSVDVEKATIDGGMLLRGTSIGGDLDCGGAQLVAGTAEAALSADRVQITGSLLLNPGPDRATFRAEGAVRIRSATIGGHASCRGGQFSNPGRRALNLSGSRFAGDLLLAEGFSADGETRLQGATIGSDLVCTGGSFSDPGGVALRLVGVQVAGIVLMDDGFVARGEVRISAATVGGYMTCAGGRFVNREGDALRAVGARIAGTLTLAGGFHAEGAVVLRDASVGTLRDDADSWPDAIDLDGCRYERLVCPRQDRGWRARRSWLRRQTTPSAQGYVGLAAVYRAAGDELDARRILIERHNALLRPPEPWRAQLPSGPMELARRLWRWVLRLTIGHGFAPGRSLLIALPLVAGLALWVGHARQQDMLVATDDTALTDTGGEPRASRCDDRYPCLQPAIYAVDTMIPIVELGQRTRWTPDQSHRGTSWWDDGRWLAAATWTTSALGWVLATLVAASFTQIVRRE